MHSNHEMNDAIIIFIENSLKVQFVHEFLDGKLKLYERLSYAGDGYYEWFY